MIGVGGAPPRPLELESFLDDVACALSNQSARRSPMRPGSRADPGGDSISGDKTVLTLFYQARHRPRGSLAGCGREGSVKVDYEVKCSYKHR